MLFCLRMGGIEIFVIISVATSIERALPCI